MFREKNSIPSVSGPANQPIVCIEKGVHKLNLDLAIGKSVGTDGIDKAKLSLVLLCQRVY